MGTSLWELYQASWNHDGEPEYRAAVQEASHAARRRLLRFQDRHQLDPTVMNFRRLVDVEFDLPDLPRYAARRGRWHRKTDVLLGRLRRDDAVVDCGCGFGTEAIAFAIAGAQVTGVDLYPAFARIFESRAVLYSEVFGVDLAPRLSVTVGHLPQFAPGRSFRLAWSNESIEHIAPLDQFLTNMRRWLEPRGAAVICNDNALNLPTLCSVMCRRRSLRARHDHRRDPSTGQTIAYGLEAIMSPFRIRALLLQAGFRPIEMRFVNVVPSALVRSERLHRLAERTEQLASVPAIDHLAAGDYVAVAGRGAMGEPEEADVRGNGNRAVR